jgi:hypothetical protein
MGSGDYSGQAAGTEGLMARDRRKGLRQAERQTQKDRDIEAEIGRIASKAMKKMSRELEQAPSSITIEAHGQSNGDDERVREIAARLFKRGQGNGAA